MYQIVSRSPNKRRYCVLQQTDALLLRVYQFVNLYHGALNKVSCEHKMDINVKQMYRVDSNWQILGEPMEASSVRWISYWYSMWSHRRDGLWKGFVQVDLDSTQDPAALQLLTQAQADLGVMP